MFDESEDKRVAAIGSSIGSSLSLRTAQMQLDDVLAGPESGKIEFQGYNARCRFTLRFAEFKDEQGAVARKEKWDRQGDPWRFIFAQARSE